MKKRTYKRIRIQQLDLDAIVAQLEATALRAIIAIDIAKTAMVFGIANRLGETLKLVRFEHPTETRPFLACVDSLRARGVSLEIVLEPTGTYGDALRYQLVKAGHAVFMGDPKRTHDAAMVFDGVPSMHDAKACTVLAQLHARGLSKRWVDKSQDEKRARGIVDLHHLLSRPLTQFVGVLEALLAAHWPELLELVHHDAKWHLRLLERYPTPASVEKDPDGARALLRRATRGGMATERIERVVSSAATSLGAPVDAATEQVLATTVRQMLELKKQIADTEKEASTHVRSAPPGMQSLARGFGPMTALAIFGDVGDPARFSSARAFEKALGLNLKERSSGEDKGQLKITKRGPSRARRYLFMAALRAIASSPIVRAWYERRKGFAGGMKLKGVVAVMRKLARAAVHVARGAELDYRKLFDVRRLGLADQIATASAA